MPERARTAELNGILSKVRRLQLKKLEQKRKLPQVGLAFVAMRANVAEFPELLRWGLRHHVRKYSVSNLLPHTAELKEKILFRRSLYNLNFGAEVELPRLDYDEDTLKLLQAVLREDALPLFEEKASQRRRDSCPFVQKGSTSIRWDGQVSPCLPLLHTHEQLPGGPQAPGGVPQHRVLGGAQPAGDLAGPGLHRAALPAAGFRFLALQLVQQLRLSGCQP